MRASFAILSAAALLAACSTSDAREAKLSGVEGTRNFAVSDFNRVSLSGSDNVVVKVGPAASVSARGDTAILDRLEVEVVDGELRIGRKKERGIRWNRHNADATVTVTLPQLRGVAVAGSGNMDVDKARADAFAASIAGSGNLRIASLDAEAASLDVAGSGNALLAGRARSLDVSIAGSGNAEAAGFKAERASISIAGSGNARADVTGEAVVSILGSGDAEIVGPAKCRVSKMGSGSVRCGPA